MFTRIAIMVLATIAVLSCSSSETAIDYLAMNYDKTDHIDGMTPHRLRNLQGHIRSLTQYVYPLEVQADGTTHRGKLISGTPVYTLLFTRNGLITEEWGYRVEDIVARKTWYRSYRLDQVDSTIHWDDKGNMTSREVYTYDKDNILVGGYHEYDGQRREKVLNIAKSGDTLVVAEQWAKIYYVNGRRVKVADNSGVRMYRYNYFPSGALQRKVVTKRGKLDLDERFDESGNLLYRLSTEYKDGQLNYSNERIITYRNDLREQEIEKHFDEPHAWTDTFTYEYKDRRPIRSFKDGQPFGFYEYNEHNDVLRERNDWFNEGYRYISYDAQGNWTERILLAGDKPFHVEVRKFAYY